MMLFVALLGLVVLVMFGVAVINRLRRPDYTDIEVRDANRPLPHAGHELTILTWNIGYGALGQGADLHTDGGTSLRALSKSEIITAAREIANRLSQTPYDLICLQEVAQPSITTRNVDVQGQIDDALPSRHRFFWADINTVLLPRPLRIRHGMATYCAKLADHCQIIDLPDANAHMLGFIKKPYVGLVNKLPIKSSDKAWVIINIHLPIFNMTPATRAAQLDRLFEVAQQEYRNGNYVVIGGDWNTQLCATSFPHETDAKFLTDYTDFPQGSLPDGWQIKADPKSPTVRALNAAFMKGITFTTVFDGFVVSPNVRTTSVKTFDLDFAHSDHQPVGAKFYADV